MANGEAFEHAVALAKSNPSIDIGIHLTLTEEKPVSSVDKIKTLIDSNGHLPKNIFSFAADNLKGKIALEDVRHELREQIRRVLDYGIPVTHLDGHQHVHALPGVAKVVVELAKEHGIRAVRYPAEPVWPYLFTGKGLARRLFEQTVLGFICTISPLRLLKHPQRFVGFNDGGNLTEDRLVRLLTSLPPGKTVELMCHPGQRDPQTRYAHWNYHWELEMDALLSPRVRDYLHTENIRLISYRDI